MSHTGWLRWSNAEKRYGFVILDEGGELFFHPSAIRAPDPRVLEDGHPVSCDEARGPKGRQAE
ncbi:MAG TPA: cold shock domain-containing protein, partial [Allosphingosinicella sp.]|nr:cold shock domain-containing protein [Allosphingosinicella sp.]